MLVKRFEHRLRLFRLLVNGFFKPDDAIKKVLKRVSKRVKIYESVSFRAHLAMQENKFLFVFHGEVVNGLLFVLFVVHFLSVKTI